MNKLLVLSLFASIFLVGIVSAADYGYSNSYTVKESYDSYGYSYYQKSNSQTPWGEKTTYTRIKDYDAVPSFYIGDRNPYKNPVSTYWKDGPFHGYSSTQKYLDYHYDEKNDEEKTNEKNGYEKEANEENHEKEIHDEEKTNETNDEKTLII
jgi:hypothetical protein